MRAKIALLLSASLLTGAIAATAQHTAMRLGCARGARACTGSRRLPRCNARRCKALKGAAPRRPPSSR